MWYFILDRRWIRAHYLKTVDPFIACEAPHQYFKTLATHQTKELTGEQGMNPWQRKEINDW